MSLEVSRDGFIDVGDMHAQKQNLFETAALVRWIRELSDQYGLPVVFKGDQYHDHGIARVEIIEFWVAQFSKFRQPVVALVGNHDMNHEGTDSVMVAHADKIQVVDKACALLPFAGWGALPFFRKNEDFIKGVKELYGQGIKNILCHQEIDGAQYENGFYAPHGVKMSDLPVDVKLNSGHIHKRQEFGNVWYPGTPRHLTRSDIGEEKGIWIVMSDGRRKFLPTPATICTPFRQIEVTPNNKDVEVPDSAKVYVDIKGPKEFVLEAVRKLSDGRKNPLHIRTFPDPEQVQTDIKESDGINVAFQKYLGKYCAENNLSAETVRELSEAVYELAPSLKRASG